MDNHKFSHVRYTILNLNGVFSHGYLGSQNQVREYFTAQGSSLVELFWWLSFGSLGSHPQHGYP